MDAGSSAKALLRMLDRVVAGSVHADLDGRPVLDLDADARNVKMEVDTFLMAEKALRDAMYPGDHLRLWEIRGVPGSLARAGWQISLREGPKELVRVGRGVSPTTGHVHVSPSGLWKMRKLL